MANDGSNNPEHNSSSSTPEQPTATRRGFLKTSAAAFGAFAGILTGSGRASGQELTPTPIPTPAEQMAMGTPLPQEKTLRASPFPNPDSTPLATPESFPMATPMGAEQASLESTPLQFHLGRPIQSLRLD